MEQKDSKNELKSRAMDLERGFVGKDNSTEKRVENEDKYKELFRESLDAIYITSRGGKFLDVNPALSRLFGYTRDELINELNAEQIYAHPGDRIRFQKKIEKDGLVRSYRVKFRKKNRMEMDCLLTGTVRRSKDGEIVGYQGIIRDITDIVRSERIRNDVHRMMRHDLKTPIIGIRGLIELLLKDGEFNQKQMKTVKMIRELSDRMLVFIDRARDLFQMEQGVYTLNPVEVNLLEILRRIRKTLGDIALAKNVSFSFNMLGRQIDLKDKFLIAGEETLLETMFTNLIKNAIEASPDGGTVNVSMNTIEMQGQPFHLIDIHNLGAIPMDIRENFFEPYTTSGKASGTGLGTHSALLVARTHKGDINFTTSEQEGTHLFVSLPVNIV